MSHGPAGEGGNAEPNLTPLLDVVLQLLMFFMMCVNFVSEQVNEDVKLPKSQAVKPMDKADADYLFINLKPFTLADFQDRVSSDKLVQLQEKFREGDECILVLGKDPMRLNEFRIWLRQQFDDAKQIAQQRGANEVTTAIVIRAHKEAEYKQFFDIMQLCKNIGYRRFMFRALTKNTPGGAT